MELGNVDKEVGERALCWVAEAVHPGAEVIKADRLLGGISTPIYRLKLRAEGNERDVVLRLFKDEDWLKQEPDLVSREAVSLRRAALNGEVPTPQVIAVDETGATCGVPATLMSRLKGSVVLEPADRGGWLDGLARALVAVHRVEPGDLPWGYRPYSNIADLDAPSWSSIPEQWKRAVAIIEATRPAFVPQFIHRDYHPANVLWSTDGEVSGIVDWVNGCIGPAGVDVGHCRVNLAQLHGVDAADEFLERYRELAGDRFDYDPYWDFVTLFDFGDEEPDVYQGWTALGMTGLTKELIIERLDTYLLSLLERISNAGKNGH
ncbi:phosphotransferase family protein [Cohnella soli]|uniref:Phosphotransferase family protein n=1 Tax=Cohnella soli TaxID=425005 RepID=A0ABW0HNJ5_9BACL